MLYTPVLSNHGQSLHHNWQSHRVGWKPTTHKQLCHSRLCRWKEFPACSSFSPHFRDGGKIFLSSGLTIVLLTNTSKLTNIIFGNCLLAITFPQFNSQKTIWEKIMNDIIEAHDSAEKVAGYGQLSKPCTTIENVCRHDPTGFQRGHHQRTSISPREVSLDLKGLQLSRTILGYSRHSSQTVSGNCVWSNWGAANLLNKMLHSNLVVFKVVRTLYTKTHSTTIYTK